MVLRRACPWTIFYFKILHGSCGRETAVGMDLLCPFYVHSLSHRASVFLMCRGS